MIQKYVAKYVYRQYLPLLLPDILLVNDVLGRATDQ